MAWSRGRWRWWCGLAMAQPWPVRGLQWVTPNTEMASTQRAVHEHARTGLGLWQQSASWKRRLEEVSNRVFEAEDGTRILAYEAARSRGEKAPCRVVVLLHECFGPSESIAAKADLLSKELGCTVVAPDTFRGASTFFIPSAIWLALSTDQRRVNADVDAVLRGLGDHPSQVAVVGFCYGGGKALRYAVEARPDAAVVVFYGQPLLDGLERLDAPVLAVYGGADPQFPRPLVDAFKAALDRASVDAKVLTFDAQGHAFVDVDAVQTGASPDAAKAWAAAVDFLRAFFLRSEVSPSSNSKPRPFFAFALAALLALGTPAPAPAVVDCDSDCLSNCARVAPANPEYCRLECADYCSQTDRRDGLSGSVSDDRGYLGLASPLGGTVQYGADKPPDLPAPLKRFFTGIGVASSSDSSPSS